ncbi:MAG: zf-HC2 domain-containing protein [Candidatus Atribacteria bacterium]|nr:zf-HC2 domain-containing protein [Candidatus Atribacteria bacterium]
MDCSKIKNYLSAYIDGELSEEQVKEVRRHLFTCQECEIELKRMQALKSMIEKMNQSFRSPIDSSFSVDQMEMKCRSYRIQSLILVSVIACIAILFLVLVLPFYISSLPQTAETAPLGDIHRNLTADSYDVPGHGGRVMSNFLKQASSDR